MSQARLAELSGVSERTVRAIEAGSVERPQHESLRRIAAVLAYGEGHGQRLVRQWTGTSTERTPEELGVPDWESLHQLMRLSSPENGGQISSFVSTVIIGPDRLPLRRVSWEVREPMSATGPPVIWSVFSEPCFDVSTVRFEVTTGGVVDDFIVRGEVAAVAIRPDPAIARRGPFVLELVKDMSNAVRLHGRSDDESMYGVVTPLRLAAVVVRFTGPPPERVWSVHGGTAASAERVERLAVASDGSVQVCLHDVLGVYGIHWDWDWDDDEPTAPGEVG